MKGAGESKNKINKLQEIKQWLKAPGQIIHTSGERMNKSIIPLAVL
jgi:hypothetical protein